MIPAHLRREPVQEGRRHGRSPAFLHRVRFPGTHGRSGRGPMSSDSRTPCRRSTRWVIAPTDAGTPAMRRCRHVGSTTRTPIRPATHHGSCGIRREGHFPDIGAGRARCSRPPARPDRGRVSAQLAHKPCRHNASGARKACTGRTGSDPPRRQPRSSIRRRDRLTLGSGRGNRNSSGTAPIQ